MAARARDVPQHREGLGQAIAAAARAWNSSGAHVRLVAAPASAAGLRISSAPTCPPTSGGASGNATIGYFPRDDPSVLVPLCPGGRFRPSRGPNMRLAATRSAPTDPFALNSMTITAVHEFGHVLGLGHELHRCAIMYPTAGLASCPQPPEQWQYRCRVLEPDDVAGAVRLYGGRVRPISGPAFCSHPPPDAPTDVSAAADTASNSIRVGWRNPTGSWLTEVAIATAVDRCPTADEAQDYETHPVRGALGEKLVYWPGSGHVCVSVFSRDLFGRFSAPATTWLDSA